MAKETRKKAKSVTIIWEDGQEETLEVGDEGDVFVVVASEDASQYASMWSGGIILWQSIMVSAIQFRARIYAKHIKDQDRQMVDRFIEDALGGEDD